MNNRQSIRLKGWNYSRGLYFVTVDVKDKWKLFWEKKGEKIPNTKGGHIGPPVQNKIGNMIDYWWKEIPNHFVNISLDEYVVMPDHLHGILLLNNSVGVDRCVDPKLGDVIQWFKTMTTNEYFKGVNEFSWPRINKRLWQRNYFEEIIRGEEQLNQTRKYIFENTIKWINQM
ncbi:MAG: transposase [Candidatus Shapirobacteria bacterium]|nr:transposase [Candidatus Shapirobacteria bacterium]